ncbi:hypothetical protein HYPSUDRAFT_206151 [Hypholoma sublateritium FD-334 SS-4]|uniref:Uncharacterized protein n=1 Tax=Hypholoma sublateritium (strain FD-334 SS-4) TaxID=945553 RepID=A0A0D2NLL3_HYPSF|nr:hypothetical protein HYPSUDRAFT_206151 [Hypholoma sublateritium FD-334 SS-4]
MAPRKNTGRTAPTKQAGASPSPAKTVQPKRTRRTKAEMNAAKEAKEVALKKKEAQKRQKLTNVAQAADNVVLSMQAQESSQSHDEDQPVSRTVPPQSDDQQSDFYHPSVENSPRSESFIDPASESQSDASEALPKKNKRSRKALVLAEIQAQRQHLDPIFEEQEVVEKGQEEMTRGKLPPSRQLPFKAGLKKSWVPTQTDDTEAGGSVKTRLSKPANKSGIPEDESDTEEYAAAKSSPIKAGKRVTSAVCDSNSLTYFLMLTSP